MPIAFKNYNKKNVLYSQLEKLTGIVDEIQWLYVRKCIGI